MKVSLRESEHQHPQTIESQNLMGLLKLGQIRSTLYNVPQLTQGHGDFCPTEIGSSRVHIIKLWNSLPVDVVQ